MTTQRIRRYTNKIKVICKTIKVKQILSSFIYQHLSTKTLFTKNYMFFHASLSSSVQSYAIELRKTLLRGVLLEDLLNIQKQYDQWMKKFSLYSFQRTCKESDLFSLQFLNHLEVYQEQFLQKQVRYHDNFPWIKAYQDFQLDIQNSKNISDIKIKLNNWKDCLPQWVFQKNGQEQNIEISIRKTQSIRSFLYFLKEENAIQLWENITILRNFSWPILMNIHFAQGRYLWKISNQSKNYQIFFNHGFATLPSESMELIYSYIIEKKQHQDYSPLLNDSKWKYFQQFIETPFFIPKVATGIHIDLEKIIVKVIKEWFPHMENNLPKVVWLNRFTTKKLAHYSFTRDEVAFSPIFDLPHTSKKMLEYLAYHELLHRELGETWENGRRKVHTKEFRRRERLFPNWKKLEDEIQLFLDHKTTLKSVRKHKKNA